MKLFVAGLSHQTAPVELRELLAVESSQLVSCAGRLKRLANLDEIVLLSTCNRVEIYGTTPRLPWHIHSLFGLQSPGIRDFGSHVYVHEDLAAVRHLFRVAAGLDSMILGETEITGQVKQAYDIAKVARLTGGTLNRVFQTTFQALKEIRSRTGIGRGATSVGSVAVQLAEKVFLHNLSKQSVIIIGAGQMGETCVRHLAKKGARSILVSNRSFDRAVELARKFGGRALRYDDCLTAIADADIVVASTGCPKTLLHHADVQKLMCKRPDRPLFLIDISVPRNIDASVQRLDNVYLYNIDDLEGMVRENVRSREQELVLCQQIIDSRAAELMKKLKFEKERHFGLVLPTLPRWAFHNATVFSS